MLHADVLASTRPAQVVVTCFDQTWQLVFDRAEAWIGAIGFDPEHLSGVFPGGIMEEDLDRMWESSANNHADSDRRWLNAARRAVDRGSGRDWWWSVNLTMRCLRMWPYINGLLLLSGVDAAKMSFPTWLDAAFMLLWERQDEDGRAKLDLELSMPPAGTRGKAASRANRKMMEAFAAD